MKKNLIIIATLGLTLNLFAAEKNESPFKTQKDKVSYCIGLEMGKGLKQQGIDIDPSTVASGIKDGIAGGKTLLTEQEIKETMTNFQQELVSKETQKRNELSEKNMKTGETFLAENKKKEGVKTLASGLQYKVVKAGSGKTPKATDTVTTHYRGTLIDGTEFDSSYKRNEPATFPVNGVIPGWQEALQLMKEGDKWQLYIPSNLAYGERGAGQRIGPNTALIFDIELISIK